MNGKGKATEKGRRLSEFRDGYDGINGRKKTCAPTTQTSRRKTNTKIRSFNGRTEAT